MAKIKQIKAREILDSRGNPAVEATVILSDGTVGISSCPSGASVGTYEAVELRDHDQARFKGLGVLKAIENIEKIIVPKLLGMEASKQQEIDRTLLELDGTQNKGRLGANATLSVSMAVSEAAAKSAVLPLFLYLRQFIHKENTSLKIPSIIFNLINGGMHAGNNLDFQEFQVVPATSKPYSEALATGITIYNSLKDVLKQNNLPLLVGDEGGFGPTLSSNMEAFALLKQAVASVNLRVGFDLFFGLDAAANHLYRDGHYYIKDKAMSFSSADLTAYYETLNKEYGLLYIEDPFFEDDWNAWANLSAKISHDTMVVGDDITATNPYRLQMAIDKKAITGIIIKPNQIGTVLEALAVVEVARAAGLKIIVSHRSGETNDSFIADFAVAVSADYVKFGAPVRGERVAKYNRLLQIENLIKEL